MDIKISVIIPTLNEEKGISRVLAEISRSCVQEVIIVDSSTDNTSSMAKELGVKVVREPKRGYGRALQTGIELSEGDIAVYLDGDCTYDPKEISKLIEPITQKDFDIVLGSRFKGKILPGSMDLLHRFGNIIISLIFNVLFFRKVSDTQTGFRAIKKSWLNCQSSDAYGMEYVTQQMIQLVKRGARLTEVPVTYRPRTGNTKLSPWKDGYSILKTILGERLIRSKSLLINLAKHSEFTPHVSIVVTVKNEGKKVNETLESLTKIDYPKYEVILVDGGSNDNTINFAKKFPVKIIHAPDSTPGQGRNIGVENSSGEIIAFTDGDCAPEKNWLRNAVSLLKSKGVGGVGGPIISHKESSHLSKALLNILSTFFANGGSTNFTRHKDTKMVKNIPSCNAIYRREILEKAGLFSDDLRYCEDVDLNCKIREKGYSIIYSPDVVVKHNWKVDSFRSLFRFMLKYGAGRAIANRKYRHLASFLHILPSVSLISILFVFAGAAFLYPLRVLAELLVFLYLALSFSFGFCCLYRFRDIKTALVAPITYIITHFGYALGFILGLILGEKTYSLLGK
jgi:glycosyltransferase involved in cell wall biosynthesis